MPPSGEGYGSTARITGRLIPAGPHDLTGHPEGLRLEAEEPLAVGLGLCRQLRARKRKVVVSAEVLTVEIDPVPLRAEALSLGQNAGQSHDVAQRHLQGLVLGQLLVVIEGRDNIAKLVEGVIQPVHPASLPGVGRQPPLLLHPVHLFAGRGALAAAAQLVYHHPAFQLAQLFPHFYRSRALAAATAAAPSHQLPSGVRLVPGRGGLGGTQLWGMEQVLGGACRADALQSGSQPGAWVGAVQEGQLRRVDRMLSRLQGRRRLGWRRLREVVRLGMTMVVPQLLPLSPLFCMQQAGHCTVEARRLRVGGGTGKQAQPKIPSRVSTLMS